MRRSRGPRLVRGVAAATAATWIALLSHVTAGGDVPGWAGIAVPWALSLAVCTILAGRRLSLVRLTLAVAVSQALFHLLFVVGASGGGASGMAGHVHGASALMPMTAASAPVPGADITMWAGHGVAALLTVAVIHRGELIVRRLLAVAADLRVRVRARLEVPSLTSAALLRGRRIPVLVGRADAVPSEPIGSVVHRRGPPSAFAL